jgi:hypothetical protein
MHLIAITSEFRQSRSAQMQRGNFGLRSQDPPPAPDAAPLLASESKRRCQRERECPKIGINDGRIPDEKNLRSLSFRRPSIFSGEICLRPHLKTSHVFSARVNAGLPVTAHQSHSGTRADGSRGGGAGWTQLSTTTANRRFAPRSVAAKITFKTTALLRTA